MGLGIDDLLKDKRDEILKIAAKHGASNVRVFGSVARGEARPDSDVDFLVEGLENSAWGGGGLVADLQTLLGRRVEIGMDDELHPLIREHVLKEAKSL